MSAPTTAEVREAVEQAALAQETLSPSMPAATVFFAVGAVLEDVALPIAEHRDALAAEVARLRKALAASEARGAAFRARLVATAECGCVLVQAELEKVRPDPNPCVEGDRCSFCRAAALLAEADGVPADVAAELTQEFAAADMKRAQAEAAEARRRRGGDAKQGSEGSGAMRTTKTRRDVLKRWLAIEDYEPSQDDMAELLADLDEQLENVAAIALAAGLGADATAEEVAARVGEMRSAVDAARTFRKADTGGGYAVATCGHLLDIALARLTKEAGRDEADAALGADMARMAALGEALLKGGGRG